MGIINDAKIHLEHTFESGQIFRYFSKDGWYYVQHADKCFKVRSVGNNLEFAGNVDEAYIRDFFRLDEDVEAIFSRYKTDKTLMAAYNRFSGLRLIRQDPWECMVSFLCSSASNIPKIKMNVEYVCKAHGTPIDFEGQRFHTFPALGALKDLTVLKNAKTGFRSKYIHKTNALINEQIIQQIRDAPYSEAKDLLMEFPGIGEKVADCILLFAFDKGEAFPVDTWMLKIMTTAYLKRKLPPHKVAAYARKRFGKDAGYVQQYLFYASRLGK
jgi:N-glycosylase/DNA lyase